MTHKTTLRSHTHWQAPQADTQTKACQRVCLPYRTDDRKEQRRHNSTLPKVAVQCFVGQFCGYINFSASYERLC